VETIVYGYGLVEAPRADEAGGLYFSDATGGGVYRWSPGGEVVTIVPKRRGIGGLVLHADGGIVISGRDVVHVRAETTRLLLRADGVLGFNDMIADAAGRVLVGSLRSNALEMTGRVPGELWRIDAEQRGAPVYDDVEFANGVGLSPDGRVVYHSDYSRGHVLAHDLDAEGEATNRRVLARVPRGNPDGLAVDERGDVWVALGDAGGIARFTAGGELREVIGVPAAFVASLCFGGVDRRDVFVATAANTDDPTRGGTVFRMRADAPGVAVACARV
jgi:xylono-1,5-lactonase